MNPLCLMAVYTLVFSHYMRFDGGPRYHLMVFGGLLPWIWSSSALAEGTASLVSSGHLITKSMFPAHVLPFVSVTSSMVHFVLALPMLAIFMVASSVPLTWTWLTVPFIVLMHGIFLDGLVLALSALNVFYRDVQHLVGNVLTFLFFLCPIVYPPSAVPERFRFMLDLNPFALLTELYQMVLIEGRWPSPTSILYMLALSLVTWILGALVHDHFRERFAEAL
jgi:ABC-type polysaccharide/polyol phosphate export permease